MTSQCHILEAAVQRPSKYGPSTLEVWPVGPGSNMPEGLEEVLASSGISSHYLTLTRLIHVHSEEYVPIPIDFHAVQLLFGGLTVIPIPYRPVS